MAHAFSVPITIGNLPPFATSHNCCSLFVEIGSPRGESRQKIKMDSRAAGFTVLGVSQEFVFRMKKRSTPC